MPEQTHLPNFGFRVDWAKLNNEVFAAIRADAHLLALYEAANSREAEAICADIFDRLAGDPAQFVARYIIVES